MPRKQLTPEMMQQAIDLLAAHGSSAAGARVLNIPASTFKARVSEGLRRGLKSEVQRIPPAAGIPEGYKLKGTSTLYNKEGEVTQQWVKTDAKLEELQRMQRAALAAMMEELKPLQKITGPKSLPADLLNLYTLTDCHIGMMAWGKETG